MMENWFFGIRKLMLLTALSAIVAVSSLRLPNQNYPQHSFIDHRQLEMSPHNAGVARIPDIEAQKFTKYSLYASYSYNCIPCFKRNGWDQCRQQIATTIGEKMENLTFGAEVVKHFNKYLNSQNLIKHQLQYVKVGGNRRFFGCSACG